MHKIHTGSRCGLKCLLQKTIEKLLWLWLTEPSCHQYTKVDNLKLPLRSLLCEWVTEMVKNPFYLMCYYHLNRWQWTYITLSQDNHVRPKEVCLRRKLTITTKNDENDPFASEEDNREIENNEACINEKDDDEE